MWESHALTHCRVLQELKQEQQFQALIDAVQRVVAVRLECGSNLNQQIMFDALSSLVTELEQVPERFINEDDYASDEGE